MRNLWILAFIDSKRTWKLQISLQIGCVDFLGCLRYHKLEYLVSLKSNQTWSNLGRIWWNFCPKLHPITQNPFRKPSPTNFCYSPGTWSPISTKKSGFVLKSWLLLIDQCSAAKCYPGYRQNVRICSTLLFEPIRQLPRPNVIRVSPKCLSFIKGCSCLYHRSAAKSYPISS